MIILRIINSCLFYYLLFVAIQPGKCNVLQTTKTPDRFDIVWIKSISSTDDFNHDRSFSSKIWDFLTGAGEKKLLRPMSLIIEPRGRIYAIDQGNQSLVMIDSAEGEMKFISSCPSLVDICSNKKGDIYFTDSQLGKVFCRRKDSEEIEVLNRTIQLQRPTGVAYFSATGELWVVETTAHRVSIFGENGRFRRHIGKRGINSGEFNFPTHICIDRQGRVYLVDTMNFRIQILDQSDKVQTVFGKAGDASGYFSRPKGIATDSFGHIYVVDGLHHTVQVFNDEGNLLQYFGRQGRANGEFWMPAGIFIDDKDYIYIADSYNQRIQIFRLIQKDLNEHKN